MPREVRGLKGKLAKVVRRLLGRLVRGLEQLLTIILANIL